MRDKKLSQDDPLRERERLRRRVAELETVVRRHEHEESALRDREEQFRAIAENTGEAIIIINSKQEIIYWNKSAETVFGYSREEMLGSSSDILIPPRLRKKEKAARARIVREDGAVGRSRAVETVCLRKDGSETAIGCLFSSVKWGKEIYFMGIYRDITSRKASEEALRQSEDRFRSMAESVNDGLLIIEKGIPVFVNDKACEIYGYSREELMSIDQLKIIAPEERGRLLTIKAETVGKPSTRHQAEYWIVRKDGSRRFVRGSAATTHKGDRRITYAVVSDITERKMLEDAFHESEQRYRDLFDNLRDGVGIVTLDGEYVGANDAYLDMLGYSLEELKTLTYTDLTPAQWKGIEQKFVNQIRERGYSDIYEKEYIRKDGTVFPVELRSYLLKDRSGKPTGMVGVARDITGRKKAEQERLHLAAAVEQAAEGIVIIDAQGTVNYINPAFETAIGYSREEVAGRHLSTLKTAGPDDAFHTIIKNADSRGEIWRGHATLMKKDESSCDMDVVISPIRDEHNEISNHVLVMRDISKELEMEKQLRHAQKMEAMGTLAGGIAHDFNNILASIIGYTEMSLQDVPGGSAVEQNLGQILKSGLRARDLVKQILAFSRKGLESKKAVQLHDIVEDAVRLLRASIPTTIDIRYTTDSLSYLIMADATQIHQVLMNLCTNASQAMQEHGGALEIRISSVVLDNKSASQYHDLGAGPYAVLTVQDTGHGIDDDIIGRVFDPFFTTKEVGKGTGMGLAVVHGIIKNHNGDITLESTPGEGTTCTVLLPRIQGEPATQADQPEPLPGGKECILLVDDEQMLVDVGEKMLSTLGYTVVAATSSLEALEIFRKNPHAFHLVMTDQTMPHMTGYNLARHMMDIRPDMPVILCSGYSETVSREKAKASGIRKFIMKPINRSELARVVRSVLDHNHE